MPSRKASSSSITWAFTFTCSACLAFSSGETRAPAVAGVAPGAVGTTAWSSPFPVSGTFGVTTGIFATAVGVLGSEEGGRAGTWPAATGDAIAAVVCFADAIFGAASSEGSV